MTQQLIQSNPYQIVQGARTDSPSNPFIIRLKTDPITMDPFDLTAITAIKACFQNTDGTELMLTLGSGITVVGNPILGKIALAITAAQSALLAVTDVRNLQLLLTTSGDPFPVVIENCYSVLQTEC